MTNSSISTIFGDGTPSPQTQSFTLPLAPEMRLAYINLSDKYQLTIMSTADVGLLQQLVASKLDVDNILTKDNMYRLNASTALFAALLQQITSTNADLVKLKAEIAAIAGDIAMAGEILSGIDKVLTLVPV